MTDPTEPIRRESLGQNQRRTWVTGKLLEAVYGQVWDTQQLTEDFLFEVIGFLAPLVVKSAGESMASRGRWSFCAARPRFYFNFQAAPGKLTAEGRMKLYSKRSTHLRLPMIPD